MKAWRYDELPVLSDEELNKQSDEIVEAIRPLLSGKHPGVQGVVIADLLAIWIAGHIPSAEKQLLANHMNAVAKLVPLYREMFGTEDDNAGSFAQ